MKRFLFFILTLSLVSAVMGQAPGDTLDHHVQKAYTDFDAYRDSLRETNLDFGMILNKIFARYLSIPWRHKNPHPAETLWKKKKPKTAPVYVAAENQSVADLDEQKTSSKDNDTTDLSDSVGDCEVSIPSQEMLMRCILKDTSATGVETFLYELGKSNLHETAYDIAIIRDRYQLDNLRTADVVLQLADSLAHIMTILLADSLHQDRVHFAYREAYVQITTFFLLRLLDFDVYLGQAGSEFFIFGKNDLFARKKTYEKNVILTSMSSFSIDDVTMSIFFNEKIENPLDLKALTSIDPLELNKPLRVYSLQFNKPHYHEHEKEIPVFHVQMRLKEIDKQDVCPNLKTPDTHFCYIISGFYADGFNNTMCIDPIDSIDYLSVTPYIIMYYKNNWSHFFPQLRIRL